VSLRWLARSMRLLAVRSAYRAGEITEAEGRELLAGCLAPGDESTRVDDSLLLDAPEDTDWDAALDGKGGAE
jgi:plasmid stability protein